MGLFKKAAQNANWMGTDPQQVAAQQRAMGFDTAAFGGPSNAPVADDDPIFADVNGISLQHYAWIAKLCTNQGVTDEAGAAAIAEQNGIDGQAYLAAAQEWMARMGQNMAVGQKFRQFYDAY